MSELIPALDIRERLHILAGLLKQGWFRMRHDAFRFSDGKYEQVLSQVRIQNRIVFRKLKFSEYD
jgi:hypothetical protein